MTRVQLKRVDYNDGDIHRIDDVVEMEANQAAYALGMGDVIASAAAVSTPVPPPVRIDNRPGARVSRAQELLKNGASGIALSANDNTFFTRNGAIELLKTLEEAFGSVRTSPAMRRDPNTGLLSWGPENLVQRSEEFDNAVWGLTAITVTPNATTAPNGTLTADRIVETVANSKHQIAQSTPHALTIGEKFFTALHVKAGERTRIWGTASSGTFGAGCLAHFDLVTGTVISAVGCIASMKSLGDGWYRCIIFFTCTIATAPFTFWYLSDGTNESYVGDPTKGLYIWGIHVARSAVVLDYMPTLGAAVYGLRRHLSPKLNKIVTLIEESRTNLGTRSQEFDHTDYSKNFLTVTPNATLGPDGLMNADKIVEDSTTGAHRIFQSRVRTAQLYTISVFAKKAERSWITLRFDSGTDKYAYFDIANGVKGNIDVSYADSGIEYWGDGWYRCYVSGLATAATWHGVIGLASGNGLSIYPGDGASGVYVFGYQDEAGACMSSYIPTVAASVIRNTDNPSLPISSVPYNPVEGTMYAQFAKHWPSVGTVGNIVTFQNGSFIERLYSYVLNRGWNVRDTTDQCDMPISPTDAGVLYKIAGSYKLNDFDFASGGILASPDNSGTVGDATGGNFTLGGNSPVLEITEAATYTTKLPDAQLQALTV